jgi:NAD+ diphosphatase
MSDAIAFSGNPLDRAATSRRDPTWVEAQLASDATRFLPLWRLRPLVKSGAERGLAWARRELFDSLDPSPEKVLLGIDEGVAHFAVDVSQVSEAPETELGVDGVASFEDLRGIAPVLPIPESGVAAQARALLDWHANHPWCASCGGSTRMREAGTMRVCGDCLVEHHPRTNPVAIAAVSDGDRCLLGRSKGWPAGLYSALAGFIEPGETIEEALRREVLEEAGVRVGEVRYVRSQPWPFPSSLMIGCIAQATSTEISIDTEELEHVDWFDRATVREALMGRSAKLFVPPGLALAHHLIKEWANQAPPQEP